MIPPSAGASETPGEDRTADMTPPPPVEPGGITGEDALHRANNLDLLGRYKPDQAFQYVDRSSVTYETSQPRAPRRHERAMTSDWPARPPAPGETTGSPDGTRTGKAGPSVGNHG